MLENWGLLWMWHSLALFVVCSVTNCHLPVGRSQSLALRGTLDRGLVGLGVVFWFLRRRVGPVTFVERQIAHLWAGSMIGIALLFPLETWLGLDVLTLSPVLALIMGWFSSRKPPSSPAPSTCSPPLFLTAAAMATGRTGAHLIFGVVSARVLLRARLEIPPPTTPFGRGGENGGASDGRRHSAAVSDAIHGTSEEEPVSWSSSSVALDDSVLLRARSRSYVIRLNPNN